MTRAHRKWHAWLWLPLALLIVLGLAAALAVRPARHWPIAPAVVGSQTEAAQ